MPDAKEAPLPPTPADPCWHPLPPSDIGFEPGWIAKGLDPEYRTHPDDLAEMDRRVALIDGLIAERARRPRDRALAKRVRALIDDLPPATPRRWEPRP